MSAEITEVIKESGWIYTTTTREGFDQKYVVTKTAQNDPNGTPVMKMSASEASWKLAIAYLKCLK